jgi:prepilin-type processing-associated H-X9-DG protein
LIELLVVIAILAILAALSLSVARKMHESAKAATCASNMRQVGSAIIMYATDNGGKLPPLQPPLNGRTGKRGHIWPPIVAEAGYLWNGEGDLPCGEGVWTCPSCDFMAHTYGGYGVAEDTVFVYGEKFPQGGVTEPGSLRLTMIDRPSSTWLIGDTTRDAKEPNKGWYAIWSNPSRWDSHGPALRHGGKANVCMVDGHVEALTLKEIEDRELTRNITPQ